MSELDSPIPAFGERLGAIAQPRILSGEPDLDPSQYESDLELFLNQTS